MSSQLGESEGLGERIKVVYTKLSEASVVENLSSSKKKTPEGSTTGIGTGGGGSQGGAGSDEEEPEDGEGEGRRLQYQLKFALTESIKAKIVKKCGVGGYWSDWAEDVAQIASRHMTRIGTVITQKPGAWQKFEKFVTELRDDLNPYVTEHEAVQMLAQHLITRPVFETLFQGNSFTRENSVSQAMQSVVDVLDEHGLEKEAGGLEDFYNSVRWRAEQVVTSAGRQNLIRQLYEKFFQKAFKKLTERLGIVFTPVELVDYILRSVDVILREQFDCGLTSEGVHVLDPFTGTGTFLARLMELDLISDQDLPRKYRSEIHANEIVPLAYYIAGINIEQAYHGRMGNETYEPFDGLCLTDTFQLGERSGGSQMAEMFPQNDRRLARLSKLDIRVIVGNPPYSAGQRSGDDNAANLKYPRLDSRIENTYAKRGIAANKNSLYDSYVRAIRWASDRIGERGVVGFVSNAGFLESNSADGLRACLAKEFSSLYVLNLRGNQRTAGELSRQEGGKIFGSGSRAPIAVTLFVKNPDAAEFGKILYHDIGDYLSREEKLARVEDSRDLLGIEWKQITPSKHQEWLRKGHEEFETFVALGDKKARGRATLFECYSRGLETARDAWCWNSSRTKLEANVNKTMTFYNSELERHSKTPAPSRPENLKDFVKVDRESISWSDDFLRTLQRSQTKAFYPQALRLGIYRPFSRRMVYFGRQLNHRVNQLPRLFPTAEAENRVICVRGLGSSIPFSALMVDQLPDLEVVSKGQCFPQYVYEQHEPSTLFALQLQESTTRKHGISDKGLEQFSRAYPSVDISKDDLFHYIYGLLHSPEYRSKYAANFFRSLPRIPFVQDEEDFVRFSLAGKELGELHAGYESAAMYPEALINGNVDGLGELADDDFHVTKMRFGKSGKDTDQSVILYNDRIRVSEVPLEAYEYVVNGKPAIKWVMERQGVSVHKESGIVNDANEFANEVMADPAYPLKLLLRIITVSLETRRIVNSLPSLKIRGCGG